MAALEPVAGGVRISAAMLQTIREQMAPDASNADLAYFAQVCHRLELSPFADQIVLVGRHDRRLGRKIHRHQITVAGRRALATRTGDLEGIDGPVWAGPRTPAGDLVWLEVWPDEAEPPYVARCLVWRRGWKVPANGTAKWSEFSQTVSGALVGLWDSMPSHMLGKCAESMALRRAFPDTITAEAVDGFAEIPDLESEAAALETGAAPAGLGRAGWTPSNLDQSAAHRIVHGLGPDGSAAFLQRFGITDFSKAWPAEAVAAALEVTAEVVGGPGAGAEEPDTEPEVQ